MPTASDVELGRSDDNNSAMDSVLDTAASHEADPKLQDSIFGDTAADKAVMRGNYKLAASLIHEGSSLKEMHKKYEPILPLMQSIQDGDEDSAIKILSSNPPTKNQLNISVKYPPLHLAAMMNLVNVVKKLLDCGAEKELPNEDGWKALELAVGDNHPDVVEVLASHENVNNKFKHIKNETLLGRAVIYGYEQVMTKLISKSADISEIPSNVKIPSSVMLKCLDDSISFAQEDKDSKYTTKEDKKILFDYKLLIGKDQGRSETEKVKAFCNSSYLPELLPHPLIKTFIFEKWRKIEGAYGIWICLKLLFLLCMLITAIQLGPNASSTNSLKNQTENFHIHSNSTDNFGIIITFLKTQTDNLDEESSTDDLGLNSTSSKTKDDPINKDHSLLHELNIIFLILFGIAELFQIINSFKTCFEGIKKFPAYFTDVENCIQLAILSCLAILLFDFDISLGVTTHRYILGALLPLSCFEFLHEVGHIPGCAHIIQIYNMVLVTFLKYLAFYGLLIISFAASFFVILSIKEEDKNFGKLFAKHIVMSTGEQEFSDAPFSEEQHWFEVVFFITFTILIVVVMMAILNALAIVDIQEMMKDAEVPMLEQLLERVLLWDNLLHSWKFNIRLFDSSPSTTLLHNISEHTMLLWLNWCFGSNFEKWRTQREEKHMYLKCNTIVLYPFEDKFKIQDIIKKKIKWFANLFLYTYSVIEDECIHGRGANNGALQILSFKEENQKISKKEDEDEKRKKVDDVQLKQNHADLKDQMTKMNDVEMKDMKVEMKDMKVEMKKLKDQMSKMNGEMTKMLNLLLILTKHENPASPEPSPSTTTTTTNLLFQQTEDHTSYPGV